MKTEYKFLVTSIIAGGLLGCNSGGSIASTGHTHSPLRIPAKACLPEKSSYPCTGNGCSGPIPFNLLRDDKYIGANSNARMHPAQVYSKMQFGFGRWTATLKPSKTEGAISSFFLFNNVGDSDASWPANWREIDFTFNPGLRPDTSNLMSGEYLVDGFRNFSRQLYITTDGSQILPLPTSDNSTLYNNLISLNTFAYNDQGKTRLSNHQYMYQMATSPYDEYHTYTIDYTPNGIWWEIDGKVVSYAQQANFNPRLGNSCTQFVHAADIDVFKANPNLNVYLNLWNGAIPDSQYFGGINQPDVGSNVIYKEIKFYPLINANCSQYAGKDSCYSANSYAQTPQFLSNFINQSYMIDGVVKGFDDLWVKDDRYFHSLGGKSIESGAVVLPGQGLQLTLMPTENSKLYTFENAIYGNGGLTPGGAGTASDNLAYITKSSCLSGTPYIQLGLIPGKNNVSDPNNIGTYLIPNDDDLILITSTKFFSGVYFGACSIYPKDLTQTETPYINQWYGGYGLYDCIDGSLPYSFVGESPTEQNWWDPSQCPKLPTEKPRASVIF